MDAYVLKNPGFLLPTYLKGSRKTNLEIPNPNKKWQIIVEAPSPRGLCHKNGIMKVNKYTIAGQNIATETWKTSKVRTI